MSSKRFSPDPSDAVILEKGWAMLALLAVKITSLVSTPNDDSRRERSHLRALLNLAEVLGRRLLLAVAMQSPLPGIRPVHKAARARLDKLAKRRRLDPRDVRYVPPKPRRPLMRLAEPLPGAHLLISPEDRRWPPHKAPSIRIQTYGILIVRSHDPNSWHNSPNSSYTEYRFSRRLAALQDLIKRPASHARRMGRWIVRQRMRRHGRWSPLKPRRAPRWRQFDRDRDKAVFTLDEAHGVACRAMATGPPRAVS